jgi:uncharacterized protein YqeY
VPDLAKIRHPPCKKERQFCTCLCSWGSAQLDSASRFTQASRPDLAEKENHEAEILSKFLPPLLSEVVIERTLTEIIDALPAGAEKQKYMGKVFKEFYSRVDQSNVDPSIVKKRAAELLARIGG